MISRRLLLLCLLYLVAAPASASAGACTEGDDRYYVTRLEALARGGRPSGGDDPFYCLDLHLGGTNRWAGPRAAAVIARFRKSRLRSRIVRACSRLMKRSRNKQQTQQCVRLLAAYGVREHREKRTYDLARAHLRFGLDFQHLAALGDAAAVAELLQRFAANKTCHEVWQKGKAVPYCTDFVRGKRNRWTRKAHREHKIGVLNALWHLAPSSARTFLSKVSRDDPVPLVRERAKKVLTRMHELRMAGLFQRYLDTGQDLSSAGLATHCAGPSRYTDREVKRLARRACAKFRKASRLGGPRRGH